MLSQEEGFEGGMEWDVRLSRCKLSYREWINNKVLLYSTGRYMQYPVINQNGKEYLKRMCVYIYIHTHTHIYIYLNHFAVQQKLTQHCKSTGERVEREVGGGIGMGKTCNLKDVSFQCMTKFTTN